MPAYDASLFAPPAPVALVGLRNQKTKLSRRDVPMLIDSGADVTLVPTPVLGELGIEPVSNKYYERLGFDVTRQWFPSLRSSCCSRKPNFRPAYLVATNDCQVLDRKDSLSRCRA